MTKWECYIEEYTSENGLAARLRDKKTNKKISIQTHSLESEMHFLRFLNAAKLHIEIMPTIFEHNGEDIVVLYGTKQKENKNTIFVSIDKNGSGYFFE